jgi:hypothetical protein
MLNFCLIRQHSYKTTFQGKIDILTPRKNRNIRFSPGFLKFYAFKFCWICSWHRNLKSSCRIKLWKLKKIGIKRGHARPKTIPTCTYGMLCIVVGKFNLWYKVGRSYLGHDFPNCFHFQNSRFLWFLTSWLPKCSRRTWADRRRNGQSRRNPSERRTSDTGLEKCRFTP